MIKIKHNTSDLTDEILQELPSKTSTSSAKDSYIQETYFQTKAYEDAWIQPTSFSLVNQQYGRLNNDLMSIVPKENRMSTINTESDLRVLDFVADAYSAFMQEMQSFKFSNKFSPNSKIYNFSAQGTNQVLDLKYDLFLQDQYSSFVSFVNTKKIDKEILDIDSFVSVFSRFIDSRTPATPFNKSTYAVSNRVTRNITGLSIDLDSGDVNDDNNKVENYINDEDFQCFQDLASSFGFTINKDIPWQIVADLNSIYLKYYFHLKMLSLVEQGIIEESPVPSTERKFENCQDVLANFDLVNFLFDKKSKIQYYDIINYNDLENLKLIIYYFYNSYVQERVFVTDTKLVKDFNLVKIQQEIKTRRIIYLKQLNTKKYNNLIQRLYVYIKAKEANASWSQTKFDSVVSNVLKISKNIDSQNIFHYIQNELLMIARTKAKQSSFNL